MCLLVSPVIECLLVCQSGRVDCLSSLQLSWSKYMKPGYPPFFVFLIITLDILKIYLVSIDWNLVTLTSSSHVMLCNGEGWINDTIKYVWVNCTFNNWLYVIYIFLPPTSASCLVWFGKWEIIYLVWNTLRSKLPPLHCDYFIYQQELGCLLPKVTSSVTSRIQSLSVPN